jgi:UDPglucose 6-dehydrogenase
MRNDSAALLSTARERVMHKLLDELRVPKKRVGALGLAFKLDTDDLRDSLSLEVARKLVARGALVVAHDPVALPRARAKDSDLAKYCGTVEELAQDVNALWCCLPSGLGT